MASRSLRLGEFALQLTVPDRVAARARRWLPQPQGASGLVFREPPPLQLRSRDPERSLDFREEAHTKGREREEAVGPTGQDELSAAVRSTTWYHTIDLGHGIVTPGQFDHRPLMPSYGFPPSLEGQRALDAATFNGFFAFYMEQLGATVTAIDLDDPADWDFPTPVRERLVSKGEREPIGTGFEIAHRALGSSVIRVSRSLYDLDPTIDGTFDFIHCGDVLLHLREPLRALERLRSVATGRLLLSDVIDADAPPGTYGPTIQYLGGWSDVNWWIPSLPALAQMVVDAGFRNVRVNAIYNLPKTYEPHGYWRASLAADA
jgi:tRNA (mo5U34)-methyltransferase